ncbi:oligosaccharide flippase family protein [Erysipelotrichaceae bacterium HCN-30851]
MNHNSKLVRNTIIYGIGNLGSKILSYVMVLVYSYYITPEELGYYDVVLTTISMLQPLIICQINEGVFRFLLDSNAEENKDVIGGSIKFLCLTTLVSEIIFGIFCLFVNVNYSLSIALLLITSIFFSLFQDVVRGLGKNNEYALYGVLNSVVMLFIEIIGLIVFKLGVRALIISKVFAYGVCVLVIYIKHPEFKASLKLKYNLIKLKEMLKYSLPLVPNTICWWVVNSSDRYIILFSLGASYNGLYSMATKFPTILTTITSIFYLAWQESAIKAYGSSDCDKFFSSIFRKYYILLFTLCICAIPITKIVIELFVSNLYIDAWKYTGFLYLGAVFSALSSFLGIGYQISKETSKSVVTTIFAAFINFAINILFIQVIGLQAASLSTFLAYFFLVFIRIKHSKRYFTLNVKWMEFYMLFVISIIYILVILNVSSLYFSIILEVISIVIFLKFNYQIIEPYLKKFFIKENK